MKFDGIYPKLAEDYGAALYPFYLDGVAANPDLNQADGTVTQDALALAGMGQSRPRRRRLGAGSTDARVLGLRH